MLGCAWCGEPILLSGRKGLEQARTGRGYCCEDHKRQWVSRASSERMARTNRIHASERMRNNNPMRDDAARERMCASMKGRAPKVRAGNGCATVPQLAVSKAIGWPIEVAIKTGKGRSSGFPSCYKVDVGNDTLRIAIEVDGGSHNTIKRKLEDKKKDDFLASLGWTVLRFTNKQCNENLPSVIATIMEVIHAVDTL